MSDLHEGGTVVGGLASRGPRQAVAAREGAGAGGVLTHQDGGADGQAGEVVVLARLTRVVGLQACREREVKGKARETFLSHCVGWTETEGSLWGSYQSDQIFIDMDLLLEFLPRTLLLLLYYSEKPPEI